MCFLHPFMFLMLLYMYCMPMTNNISSDVSVHAAINLCLFLPHTETQRHSPSLQITSDASHTAVSKPHISNLSKLL